MVDPLNFLRKYHSDKKPIIERNDYIIFDNYSWPETTETNYVVSGSGKNGIPKTYYTLQSLLFFLKNYNTPHPVYCKLAEAICIPAVRRPDRKDIFKYLSGNTSSSPNIDDSASTPLPIIAKRICEDQNQQALCKKIKSEIGEQSEIDTTMEYSNASEGKSTNIKAIIINEDRYETLEKYIASEMRQLTDEKIYLETKAALEGIINDAKKRMSAVNK